MAEPMNTFPLNREIKQGELPPDRPNRPRHIPANTLSIENWTIDPPPDAGKGARWRACVSWVKGWFE